MTPEEIAAIANGLTVMEKSGLISAFENTEGNMAVGFGTGSVGSLEDRGLATVWAPHFWPWLTPLGLAVRQHLLAHTHPGDPA